MSLIVLCIEVYCLYAGCRRDQWGLSWKGCRDGSQQGTGESDYSVCPQGAGIWSDHDVCLDGVGETFQSQDQKILT